MLGFTSSIDNNFVFLRDLLDCICNDLQDRLLKTNDPEYARLLDQCYYRISYAYQRINNYIIIKEDK